MARHNSVGRLDDAIEQLESIHKYAQDIFNSHIEELRLRSPGVPFGVLKVCSINNRVGSDLNYVKALKLMRQIYTGEK